MLEKYRFLDHSFMVDRGCLQAVWKAPHSKICNAPWYCVISKYPVRIGCVFRCVIQSSSNPQKHGTQVNWNFFFLTSLQNLNTETTQTINNVSSSNSHIWMHTLGIRIYSTSIIKNSYKHWLYVFLINQRAVFLLSNSNFNVSIHLPFLLDYLRENHKEMK